MFDNNVYIDGTLKNIEIDGDMIGYELQTNVTYYRGVAMSMIAKIVIRQDGQEVPQEDIRISLDQINWYSMTQAKAQVSSRWIYGQPLFIRVLQPGGLSSGRHVMTLTEAVRTAYIPSPIEGSRTFEVHI